MLVKQVLARWWYKNGVPPCNTCSNHVMQCTQVQSSATVLIWNYMIMHEGKGGFDACLQNPRQCYIAATCNYDINVQVSPSRLQRAPRKTHVALPLQCHLPTSLRVKHTWITSPLDRALLTHSRCCNYKLILAPPAGTHTRALHRKNGHVEAHIWWCIYVSLHVKNMHTCWERRMQTRTHVENAAYWHARVNVQTYTHITSRGADRAPMQHVHR